MFVVVRCPCGTKLPLHATSSSESARCASCGRDLSAEAEKARYEAAGGSSAEVQFLAEEPFLAVAVPHWSQRMLTALLDPRSIQWMLMLGGGLMVLGLVIWLITQGIFKNTLVVAGALTAGSLLVHLAGCGIALKTKHRTAGHALAFLGCLLIPLNLWFYHAHDLVTLENNLWIGGVICSALYIATLLLLRDPMFLIAVEGGITLTVILLLGHQGVVSDATWLSVVFMALALISIHVERAFPEDAETFTRKRFGLPLFWCGQVQLVAAVITLLGSQALAFILAPDQQWFASTWHGNWLTQNPWLAGGLWLAAAYAYLYSDLMVRRVGWYLYAAVACLIAAEVTFIGSRLPAELMIAIPAFTALLITLLVSRTGEKELLARRLPVLSLLLAGASVVGGVIQHELATNPAADRLGWEQATGWVFVGTMLFVAICNRVMTVLHQERSKRVAEVHLFLSAASVLVAAAGLLRCLDITTWTLQAPILMLVPLGYLVAAYLWVGKFPSRPLAFCAQAGVGVILLHIVFDSLKHADQMIMPIVGSVDNLRIGLVFIEAAVFYVAYAILFRQGGWIYAATAAACGAVWQLAAYYQLPDAWYTMLYAGLGLLLLAASRFVRREPTAEQRTEPKSPIGLTAADAIFHSANALLTLGLLSGMLQALSRLVTGQADSMLLAALGLSTAAGLVAVALAPNRTWRRIYAIWSIALAGVSFLVLNVLIDLTAWQKAEVFAIVVGLILLVASYIGRFIEKDGTETDHVTLGLWFGSVLPAAALLIATLYYRFQVGETSLLDEMGLVALSVVMLFTGIAWQLKSPAVVGGITLGIYLLVLIGMLAYFPNATMGLYLAIGGGLLFLGGIALSIFRDRLIALPQKINNREGVFQVLNWR
jgi:hypothetical protein